MYPSSRKIRAILPQKETSYHSSSTILFFPSGLVIALLQFVQAQNSTPLAEN